MHAAQEAVAKFTIEKVYIPSLVLFVRTKRRGERDRPTSRPSVWLTIMQDIAQHIKRTVRLSSFKAVLPYLAARASQPRGLNGSDVSVG